eukprot:3246021-Prymnesium_polylepis.1
MPEVQPDGGGAPLCGDVRARLHVAGPAAFTVRLVRARRVNAVRARAVPNRIGLVWVAHHQVAVVRVGLPYHDALGQLQPLLDDGRRRLGVAAVGEIVARRVGEARRDHEDE